MGIPNPARLKPHMVPTLRELLAIDRGNILKRETNTVQALLFGWLDTWVDSAEIAPITVLLDAGMDPDIEWSNYSTPSPEYDGGSAEEAL